jgi:hypothetical protein
MACVNLRCTAWTWHGMCELASAVQKWHVGDLPVLGFFRLPAEFHDVCYQKHTNPLGGFHPFLQTTKGD